VTAHDKFAIRAFEVNAQDYLLKPVDRERLAISLGRLEENERMVSEAAGSIIQSDSPVNYNQYL
jgi:two-component system, LytTR family, response regulator